jgi:hypothetical protein
LIRSGNVHFVAHEYLDIRLPPQVAKGEPTIEPWSRGGDRELAMPTRIRGKDALTTRLERRSPWLITRTLSVYSW